jgi:PIN domain nuclease of toxin-antitoxin system
MRRISLALVAERWPLLIDTHVWIWLMLATGNLSDETRVVVNRAIANRQARLSAISFWEIAMLASRNRLQLGKPAGLWLRESLQDPAPIVEILSPEIAVESCHLPGGFRSDPADQIIVATARLTGALLLTRDRRILDYAAAGYINALAA